ncbi:MAG: hypothetical protein AAGB19_09320 [Cyanobacteria bacterium P01_F01_bin.3]
MPNPDPIISKATQFKPQGKIVEPLSQKPINTKYERGVHEALAKLKDRQARIRRYVREGLQRDGLL